MPTATHPTHTLNPPPPPAVPQSVAHKVWIIDCKSCGTFLTNRGMKAVLLLRPNVPLYSSDALPANCSAYTTNPEALEPPISCRPPTQPSRTCECLTQTLCCQGCGSTIGYMIVIPCIRCTSSISANNRATNGHRFVFHSSEVVGTERHYVPNEPGVMPFETVPVAIHPLFHMHYPAHRREVSPPHTHISPNEYLPTPPLDSMDLSPVSSLTSEPLRTSASSSSPSSSYDGSPGRGPDRTGLDTSPPSLLSANSSFSFGLPAEQAGQTLKGGDSLFWHHLIRYGEIPGVSNDPRARKANSEDLPRKSAMFGR
ncbi:hypothetical protein EV359DRAFT_73762 [Lentinula novae-zelandiae]|nr:hypothetical protein EV359DRAFT_73762 [Lentinula novae-zelandiae]